MRKVLISASVLLSMGSMASNMAMAVDKKSACDNFSEIISCYRGSLAAHPVQYYMTGSTMIEGIKINSYHMKSQSWSPDNLVSPREWLHDIDIYIPDAPKNETALIVINNGINYNSDGSNNNPTPDFNEDTLVKIASETNTIVISVSNIPNQYLTYKDNGESLKEDDSVAHSWSLFLQNPDKRKMMSLHIPMAASVSQTMRVAKIELEKWKINNFIVTGASKRGWATWLTALSDKNVKAIVPFVIDLLNTKPALEHMKKSYGNNWPIAFFPYYKESIDTKIDSFGFSKLMEIEDPLKYMDTAYRTQFDIPKYIVNASGDDFYVPDNPRFYYDKLPGQKSLRVVPNTNHYGIKKFTAESLIPFVRRFQENKALPIIQSSVRNNMLTVSFPEAPEKIVQWTAVNPVARDFRFACGINYTGTPIIFHTAKGTPTVVNIPLINQTSGWRATYVEATFKDKFIATTQVYITPDGKYPTGAPPSPNETCRTLPGR
jgi:PhoPQ-activated pathogenicity-related protein